MLKKYFSEAPPVHLPIGHRTLALSEPHVHTLLEVVSAEAVASSLRTVQTLVSETLKAGGRIYSGDSFPVELVLRAVSLRVLEKTSAEGVIIGMTTAVGPSALTMNFLQDRLNYPQSHRLINPRRLPRKGQKEKFRVQDSLFRTIKH